MDYKSFTLQVQEEIGRYLPEPYQDVEASVHQVQKNNGIEYTALCCTDRERLFRHRFT